MLPNDNTPDGLLRALSDRLGLDYEPQDWGLINADGNRLDEFVACFVDWGLEDTQRFELAELILASANDRLLLGLSLDLQLLIGLAEREKAAFDHHIEYWLGLFADKEFPLSDVLRTFMPR